VFDAGKTPKATTTCWTACPSISWAPSRPPTTRPAGRGQGRLPDGGRAALPGAGGYETEKVVFGERRRVVLTHSEDLHAKQSAGFDQTLAKARRQLDSLQAAWPGQTKRAKDKVEAEVAEILKPRWLSRVVSVALSGEEPSDLRLSYRTNAKARAALEEEIFGKRPCSATRAPHWPQPPRWWPITAPRRRPRATSAR